MQLPTSRGNMVPCEAGQGPPPPSKATPRGGGTYHPRGDKQTPASGRKGEKRESEREVRGQKPRRPTVPSPPGRTATSEKFHLLDPNASIHPHPCTTLLCALQPKAVLPFFVGWLVGWSVWTEAAASQQPAASSQQLTAPTAGPAQPSPAQAQAHQAVLI